jgi:hypothetical protein
MPNNDLIDFMKSATRQMEDDYRQIQKSATEDPGTAGDQGEENWAKLLRNWLPHTFHVVTKGRIISEMGIASPQVDVLVLQPEYPPHLLNTKLYLAAGVLAAFECKLTLKASHIGDFIDNSVAIKSNLTRPRPETPYDELQTRLLFGLLSHSNSWKGKKSDAVGTIQAKLDSEDLIRIKHPRHMPDIICVADVACWCATKMSYLRPQIADYNGQLFSTVYISGRGPISHYSCHSAAFENVPNGSTPIGSMITMLILKLAYRNLHLRPLSRYYMGTGIRAISVGNVGRNWSPEVISEDLRNTILNIKPTNDYWDEWGVFIH